MKGVDTMPDTNVWVTYICDADLRRLEGFARFANEMTVGDVVEIYEEWTKRKVAEEGDSLE